MLCGWNVGDFGVTVQLSERTALKLSGELLKNTPAATVNNAEASKSDK